MDAAIQHPASTWTRLRMLAAEGQSHLRFAGIRPAAVKQHRPAALVLLQEAAVLEVLDHGQLALDARV